MRAACVLFGTITLGAVGFARAETAPRTFSLAYEVPAGCPARDTFVASVRARAPGTEEVGNGAELAFDVRLAPDGEQTSGTLSVRFAGGEHFEREVPAARCADVTTSMAIMAGLLLSGALLPEPPAPAALESAAPPEPAPPPVVSVTSPAPSAPFPPPPPPPVPQAPREARAARFRPGAFAHAELGLGALPFPAVGGSAGLDAALERDSLFSPSLRAGFLFLSANAALPPAGSAQFTLRALAVRACPLRLALRPGTWLHACALVDAGSVAVAGRRTETRPLDQDMLWVAFGPAARAELALGQLVSLEAELAGFGLLRHDRFVLQPGELQIHDIPVFSAALSLGVVARVP